MEEGALIALDAAPFEVEFADGLDAGLVGLFIVAFLFRHGCLCYGGWTMDRTGDRQGGRRDTGRRCGGWRAHY